jgi:hypothetical protein
MKDTYDTGQFDHIFRRPEPRPIGDSPSPQHIACCPEPNRIVDDYHRAGQANDLLDQAIEQIIAVQRSSKSEANKHKAITEISGRVLAEVKPLLL